MPSDLIDLGQSTSASAHPALSPIGGAPIDPSITLKLAPAANGLGAMESWQDLQTKMNANKLFQQGFNAKVKAGQILASAPDLDSGLAALYKDPSVAPFAGDIVNSIRQGMLANVQAAHTGVQIEGEQQKQATDAWSAVKLGLPALAADPSEATWKSVTGPALAGASPSAKKALGPALDSLRDSLLEGLPEDKPAAKAMFQARVAGLAQASPDVWGLMFGKPGTQDLGDRVQPTQTNPTTGAVTQVGRPMAKGLPPTVVKGQGPEGQDITTVWGGGTGGGNGLGGGRGSPAGMIGPTQTEGQYNTKRTDDLVEYEKSLDDRVGNGATLRKNIGETIEAAKRASMGGGAEAYMKLGSTLQALGVKTPTVDKWANGSLAASQVVDKIALQNSMSQLKQQLTGVGGSRLNAQEFVAYLNKNPNLTTDPRAAMEIFQLWNQFYDRDKKEQQAYDQFKRGNRTGDSTIDKEVFDRNDLSSPEAGKPDLKRWPALWANSDYMQKFAPGGDIPTAGVKGMPAAVPKDIADLLKKHGGK